MPPLSQAALGPAAAFAGFEPHPMPCSVPQHGWSFVAKRVLDCSIASVAIILLIPVLLAIALLIRVSMGPPILFRQKRPGRFSRPFTVLKFTTMSQLRGHDGCPLSDLDRLTHVGRFLRSTSLDELPQLWNVLCGTMSLVGPRPLLMEFLPLYTPQQAHRHDVLPGITGWAQVHGRNSLNWDERSDLDLWYVHHWSVWLDVKILLLTFWHVFKRDGVDHGKYGIIPPPIEPAATSAPSHAPAETAGCDDSEEILHLAARF